jgi:hypothetical protein
VRLRRLVLVYHHGALLLVVFGGLVIPAIIGSYLLIGVHEQKQPARREKLQRNADILALGMQESLWNMNAESAHSLVESVMRDRPGGAGGGAGRHPVHARALAALDGHGVWPSAKSWCAASASATSWSKWTMRAASRSWREKVPCILVLAGRR